MAADQLNKRSNTSLVGCTFREHQKLKKKKVEAPVNDLNMRPSISLVWDEMKKSVVAKREQVGIASKELIPFLDIAPRHHNILADAFDVPCEIFELEDLTEVLSYEVWQSHLSEKERKSLSQFLPKGVEVHEVVQQLFAGDDFHFGNPFIKWGASLCSRNCHPDDVLRQEQCSMTNKKAYYLDLQTYHNNMIRNLQTWKERWSACKHSEKEFMQKICSLKKDSERHESMQAIEPRICDPEENLGATSESCSWIADEIACSIDSPDVAIMHGENLRRIPDKGFVENKYYESSDGHKKVAARIGTRDKVHKRDVEFYDGAKYMSYIKVSKEQHQRVKSSMKPSSNSIHARSLNHVLGNLDTLCVQPYEVFEEEERQKLLQHWYQLSLKDLPAFYENRRKWQSEKRQLSLSLEREIKEKLNPMEEDNEQNKSDSLHHEQMNVEETTQDASVTSEDEEDGSSDSISQHQSDIGAPDHTTFIEEMSEDEAAQNQPVQQNSLLGNSQECHLVDVDNNTMLGNTDDFTHKAPTNPNTLSHAEGPVGEAVFLPSSGEIWPPCSLPSTYYENHTSVGHEYRSVSEFSLRHPQVTQEQPMQVIDLESDMQEQNHQRDFLQRQSGADNLFFKANPIQDRNELLLQSLSKSVGSLPYQDEQKLMVQNIYPHLQSLSKIPGSLPYQDEQKLMARDFYPNLQSLSKSPGSLPYQDEQKLMVQNFYPNLQSLSKSPGNLPFPDEPKLMVRDFYQNMHTLSRSPESLPYQDEQKLMVQDFHPNRSNTMLDSLTGNKRDTSLQLELRHKKMNDLYMHQSTQKNMYNPDGRSRYLTQEHLSPLNHHSQDWAVNGNINILASSSSSPHTHLNGGEMLNHNWFSGEPRPRDGWSGLEGVIGGSTNQNFGHGTNGGSSSDQSLFSVLSQCKGLYHSGTSPYASSSIGSYERLVQPTNFSGVSLGASVSLAGTSNMLQQQTVNPLNYLNGHEAAAGGIINNGTGWVSLPRQNNALDGDLMGNTSFLRSRNH